MARLTSPEIRSALLLALAALMIPLIPNEPMGPYGALNPSRIWRLAVLVLAIGAFGQFSMRLLGPRWGLPLSGLASGFVSSAATVGAMAFKAVQAPGVLDAAVAGAVLSTVATVAQMAAVLAATNEKTLAAMTIPLVFAGIVAGGYGLAFTLRALRTPTEGSRPAGAPLGIKTALIFTATLSIVTLASAAARARFGEAGVVAAGALEGFVDAHAAAISIASLVAAGHLEPAKAVWPILAGFTTNALTKVVVAAMAGRRTYAIRVVPGVFLVVLAAWAGALLARRAG